MGHTAGSLGQLAWADSVDVTLAALLVPTYGHAYRAAVQSLADSTITRVAFDTDLATTPLGGLTRSAGAFTVPRNGLYQITLQLSFAANATGARWGYITVNNPVGVIVAANTVAQQTVQTVNSVSPLVRITCVRLLSASDTVEGWAQQASTAALNAGGAGDGAGTYLEVTMLRAT